MREPYPDLTPWTLAFVMFVDTLCITPMALLDGVFTRHLGHALPFWLLVGGGLNVIGTLVALAFAREQMGGTVPSGLHRAATTLQGAVLLIGAPLMAEAWISLMQATTLPATPRVVIALAMAVAAAYSLAQGLEPVGRVASLVGVVALPILFIVVCLIAVRSRIALLNPLTLIPPSPWVIPGLLFGPRGYVLIGSLAGPKAVQSPRPLLSLSLVGVVFLAVCLLLPPVVLGWSMARSLTFPFFYVTSTVTSPFLPFQRIEFLVNIIWQLIVLGVVTTFLASALHGLGGPVRPNPYDWKVLALAAFLFAASLPHLTVETMTNIFVVWSLVGLLAFLVIPGGILAIYRTRAVEAT